MISYEEFCKQIAIAEAGDDIDKVREENKALCARYPFLITQWDFDDDWNATPSKDYDYEWTFLDDIPEGWKKAFGVQMCEELRDILIEGDCLDSYHIAQTKEKYGQLRWYDCGVSKKVADKYHAWLSKYTKLSEETCIKCGKPGTMRNDGWVSPWCDECYEENERRYKERLEKLKKEKKEE